jgi:hypothetical protein
MDRPGQCAKWEKHKGRSLPGGDGVVINKFLKTLFLTNFFLSISIVSANQSKHGQEEVYPWAKEQTDRFTFPYS